ncbi:MULTISPECIES: cysteine rich repeat-containing protein [unclassified Bradyrhizobium]|uniref:cysteine rich repeat-containing protein n=1 Tax=unclassified Bradyrhizobium TaxID=2631580 RepID=UPI002479DEF7|nr:MULTISPECIES: cysteine rich repeat-containing protein [unclassified Bradyrhizobium]WGR68326.1 cysteine rich repeat-containing protein [Bradyrhizobium sp. ISRA426]WGR80381.1 cysteine rich repeat-containing protein [Bradyrhizobium sp. ISRA430]WGR83566.1 cysteine rich repeat-containing protein [Bradyrhizobium sp. ISRA432]
MSKLNFAAVAFAVMFSGAALAQSTDTRGACKTDYDKFCAGIAPGTGRIVACLNAKRDQLTATCKAALDSRKK